MQNPYLSGVADSITSQVTNNLTRNILPQLRRGSVAAGGWGNSGGGIAQGQAVGDTNQGLSSALASLYGGAWESDQNRTLQRDMQGNQIAAQQRLAEMQDATNRVSIGNQFTLGMGGLDNQRLGLNNQFTLGQGQLALGNKQADQSFSLGQGNLANQTLGLNQNFYTAQRGQDLQANQQGFNQYLGALGAHLGIGSAISGIGREQFNAPRDAIGSYAGMVSPFTGLNQTRQETQPSSGGGLLGAIGGGLSAAQLWKLLNGG